MLDIKHFDILVLPGSHNSGPEHWQTHWEAAFPNLRRVEQDNWVEPVYSKWSLRLTEAVKTSKRPILFVAHSHFAYAVVAGYLQELGPGIPLASRSVLPSTLRQPSKKPLSVSAAQP